AASVLTPAVPVWTAEPQIAHSCPSYKPRHALQQVSTCITIYAVAVLAGMKAGFLFRFAGLSIEELVACKDLSTRTALFAYCRRLQEGPSDCLCPHHELVR